MKSTCVLCVYTVCITHNEEKNPFSRQQSIQNLYNSINVYLRRTQCLKHDTVAFFSTRQKGEKKNRKDNKWIYESKAYENFDYTLFHTICECGCKHASVSLYVYISHSTRPVYYSLYI